MSLNIRNFPVDLQRELKIHAAIKDTSMKDLIVKYCEAGLRREKKSWLKLAEETREKGG
jgi:plasmid stability protein